MISSPVTTRLTDVLHRRALAAPHVFNRIRRPRAFAEAPGDCCADAILGSITSVETSPRDLNIRENQLGAFHRLMAATRKRKAEDRHAREALAQDNLYPRIAALSRRVLRSEKV
jgi:hypothetical protein